MKTVAVLAIVIFFLLGCERSYNVSEIPVSNGIIAKHELDGIRGVPKEVYIPIYSNLLYHDNNQQIALQATVSIRNTDRDQPIRLDSIDYYNTNGDLVRNILKEEIGIKPFASHEVFIPTSDLKGGSGAKFLIKWSSGPQLENPPLIEAIFMGKRGSSEFAFTSRAVNLN